MINLKTAAIVVCSLAIATAGIPAVARILLSGDSTAIGVEIRQVNFESNQQETVIDSSSRQPKVRHRPRQVPRLTQIADTYQVQEQIQQTHLSLTAADLKQPCRLSIQAISDRTQLSGQIKLNGKVIRSFKGGETEINLAPYLKVGQHRLEVTGNYSPAAESVEVSFSGPGIESSQETGGSGKLNQTLLIEVVPR